VFDWFERDLLVCCFDFEEWLIMWIEWIGMWWMNFDDFI